MPLIGDLENTMLWCFNPFYTTNLAQCQCSQSAGIGFLSPEWAGVLVALIALFTTVFSILWQVKESKKAELARNQEAEKLQKQRDKESIDSENRRIKDLDRLDRQRTEDQLKVSETRRLNMRADWFKNEIYLPKKSSFNEYFEALKGVILEADKIHQTSGKEQEIEHKVKGLTKLFLSVLLDNLGPFDMEFYKACRNQVQKMESNFILVLYSGIEPSVDQSIAMPHALYENCKDLRLLLLRWVYNYRGDFKTDFPDSN